MQLNDGYRQEGRAVGYEIDLKVEELRTTDDLFFYRTPISNKEEVIIKANRILHNESIAVMNGLPETEFKGYDYPYDLTTVQLYYNSLRLISILTDAYYLTSDTMYLDEAILLYADWREQEQMGYINNRWIWYDHSAANRVLTLIYLLRAGNYAIEKEIRDDIIDCLVTHGDWLKDDNNYEGRGNHGVMQDRALLQLGVFFDHAIYVEKANTRLEKAFIRDFSSKGVHYENSIDYHMMMYEMYRDMFRLNGSNDSSATELLAKSESYAQLLKKPNGEFPLEGDSAFKTPSNVHKDFHNFYDFESGKVIIQDENVIESEKSAYIFFKSGYVSSVHKHFDDLSFVLTDNGNNIFIDAGKYNYESENEFRKYIISPKAHTTLYVEDEWYTLSKYSAELTYYKENNDYVYTQGLVKINDEVLIRNIIYIEGVVFLLDQGILTNPQVVKQNFNLSPDVSIVDVTSDTVTVENNDKVVQIKQYYNIDTVERFYEDEEHIRGFFSTTFDTLTPMHQVEFSLAITDNPIFLTEINTDTDNISVSGVMYHTEDNILSVIVGGKTLQIDIFNYFDQK